jgi:hypothetical protein
MLLLSKIQIFNHPNPQLKFQYLFEYQNSIYSKDLIYQIIHCMRIYSRKSYLIHNHKVWKEIISMR